MNTDPAVVWNGHAAPVSAWFVDLHGHLAYLPLGAEAPPCPHDGSGPTIWREQRPRPRRSG
jgi:hypothetical protein